MASVVASKSVSRNCFRQLIRNVFLFSPYLAFLVLFSACSSSRNISREPVQLILSDSNFRSAHVGISVYDPVAREYLYSHQADKYFIPASNTKLFTCYAAMKYLGDSLVGWYVKDSPDTLYIKGNADPTFLHDDFVEQRMFDLLTETNKRVSLEEANSYADFQVFGAGWAWNDIDETYMVKRSPMPLYGNLVRFRWSANHLQVSPGYFDSVQFLDKTLSEENGNRFYIDKSFASNYFRLGASPSVFRSKEFPFSGDQFGTVEEKLLNDTLRKIAPGFTLNSHNHRQRIPYRKFYSQPTDSLLKPMMHRSDNFFAEQTLLMVSTERLGFMNDAKIIDTLLKTDLKDLPQKPRWVDGSGLSRYNLFSANDFVFLLDKMKNEFAWNRITTILPTGGEGTLSSYYLNLKDKIFAKTGTLSNNIALSGYIITRQNKTLVFSVLVNNHMGNTTQIRKAVERFLEKVAASH